MLCATRLTRLLTCIGHTFDAAPAAPDLSEESAAQDDLRILREWETQPMSRL